MTVPVISNETFPNLISSFWKRGKDYVAVSQPVSGLQIRVTGTTRTVWDYLRTHRETKFADIAHDLQEMDPHLDEQRFRDILIHLVDLGLVTLDEPLSW